MSEPALKCGNNEAIVKQNYTVKLLFQLRGKFRFSRISSKTTGMGCFNKLLHRVRSCPACKDDDQCPNPGPSLEGSVM